MNRKYVYICSPYRPEETGNKERAQALRRNIELARDGCRLAVALGYIPIAPHLYFPQFLKDSCEIQRGIGMNAGLEALKHCGSVWVLGDRISEGMSREIGEAGRLGIGIECKPHPGQTLREILWRL